MAIADKLTELQATKIAIKTAIENKGQDLSGVPFTGYASKIDDIESGSSADAEFIRQFTTRTDMRYMFGYCSQLEVPPEFDTSNVTAMQFMFTECKQLTTIPKFNTSNVMNFENMFRGCEKLTTIPEIDTSKATNIAFMFYYCLNLVTIPALDIRNVNYASHIIDYCGELKTCLLRNIKVDLPFGSGHKLTQESALHLCKECIQDRDNAHTITFATPVYNNLETLYVKFVPVTDEMRAEDDLIDEKLPFELCASTDEGAMTIANYMTLKNWSIAK